MSDPILLIGAGPIAIEYTKILQTLNVPVITIGRSAVSEKQYEESTGLPVITGGYQQWLLTQKNLPERAIVAVGEKWLGQTTVDLINAGVKSILVEKPGGIDIEDIKHVEQQAQAKNAAVYVAYNRRFYASTLKAEEMIAEDGGVLSFNFEFTEWGHVIADLQKEPGVKEQWFLANSTHVIDLAFYLGGKPKKMSAYTAGSLAWHPQAAVYAGAGCTESGALFSYQANWQAPGRWGVEILTRRHRLIFRPMEKLQIQKIGSVAIEEVPLHDVSDQQFKPGFYGQVRAFLSDKNRLPTITEQVVMLQYYQQMNQLAVC